MASVGGLTYAVQASGGAGWEQSWSEHSCAMIARPPSSSSGPGRRPFKAVARVRIPLGARFQARSCGAVGVLAALSRRRSRVQVPSGPRVTSAQTWPGSSVGTSVRLKIGRSAVRPRPWPHPMTCRGAGHLAFPGAPARRGRPVRSCPDQRRAHSLSTIPPDRGGVLPTAPSCLEKHRRTRMCYMAV